MGAHFIFICNSCGYEADISGGNDIGMASASSTVLCEDCQELYDMVTTREPWLAVERAWNPTSLLCAKSETHGVVLWEHPGSCPRCGAEMIRDTATALWD